MDENEMIEDLIRSLDAGFTQGAGHINAQVDASQREGKNVRAAGCTAGSRFPTACSIPTLEQGLDDFHHGEIDR